MVRCLSVTFVTKFSFCQLMETDQEENWEENHDERPLSSWCLWLLSKHCVYWVEPTHLVSMRKIKPGRWFLKAGFLRSLPTQLNCTLQNLKGQCLKNSSSVNMYLWSQMFSDDIVEASLCLSCYIWSNYTKVQTFTL